jgi:hypothetical protein
MAEKKKKKKVVRVLPEATKTPKDTDRTAQWGAQKAFVPPSQPRKPMAARRTRSG